MRKLLDIESRSRCHKASLVPLPILVSALTECARHELPLPVLWAAAPWVPALPSHAPTRARRRFGRNDATTALLTSIKRMPRRWQLEIEKEELDKANEVCFLLEEELESEDIDELADFDFATELLLTELPYAALEEDTAKITNSALSPVPSSVAAQLLEYAEYRTAPFNRFREGSAVVSTTVESDKANALVRSPRAPAAPPL